MTHYIIPLLTTPHSCQQVIVASVGDVTLTDVERASTAGDAVVLAFNVKMGEFFT
jgi:translation initiation factor IF-2